MKYFYGKKIFAFSLWCLHKYVSWKLFFFRKTLLCVCVQESDYFTAQGEFRVDAGGSQTLLNCLMYKLSYYRFGELQVCFEHCIKHFLEGFW